jgi:hypothetical protein
MTYPVLVKQENGLELLFMLTAMLALLGPIAVGRVRCIRVTPRLLELVTYFVPMQTMQAATAASAGGSMDRRGAPAGTRFPSRWQSGSSSLHRCARMALAPLMQVGQFAAFAN